jgi:hypothetical protein
MVPEGAEMMVVAAAMMSRGGRGQMGMRYWFSGGRFLRYPQPWGGGAAPTSRKRATKDDTAAARTTWVGARFRGTTSRARCAPMAVGEARGCRPCIR